MKKITYIALLAGLVGFSSCHKFLEEHPKSEQPVDAYYSTIGQVQSAVNYLYNAGTGPNNFYSIGNLYDGTYAMTLDNLSGLANNVVAQNPSVRFYASLTMTGDNQANYVGGIWSAFYSNIAGANTIIEKVGQNQTIDPTAVAPLVATARFFRAMDYYYLVRLFGAVPLILQPYENLNNLYAPRASLDSIYSAIVADLQWAVTNGHLADKPMGANNNQVSKGTVAGILAEVQLTMAGYPLQKGAASYTSALQQAQAVINSSGG